MLAIMAVTLLSFLAANPIQRTIGAAGANAMARLMGLILASLAVDYVLRAISLHFNLV